MGLEKGAYDEMSKNGKTMEVSPEVVCDFSQVSRRWGSRWFKIDAELQQAVTVATAPERDDLTEDEQATLRVGRMEAGSRINELIDERNVLLAMVIQDIPREWLTADAPAEIDWSNPENLLDYVLDIHTSDLVQGVTLARANDSKNLRGGTANH